VDTARYNVLLVDDDIVQIDLARSAAAELFPEIELTGVPGGDAVLDWFSTCVRKKEQMPHIILLDLKLPKLDGLAVLRKLRSHAATSGIPIVVFSAEYTQDEVQMSYRAGANSFVAKPIGLAGYADFFRDRLPYWMHPQQLTPIFSENDSPTERI
jgi:CheY-like chemotaxis protein